MADALIGLGGARLGRGDAASTVTDLERALEILSGRGSPTDELAEATRLLERARLAAAPSGTGAR